MEENIKGKELIKNLANDLKRFNSPKPIIYTSFAIFLVCLLLISIPVLAVNKDFFSTLDYRFSSTSFRLQVLFLIITTFFTIYICTKIGIPGERFKKSKVLAFSTFLVFFLLFGYSFFNPSLNADLTPIRKTCFIEGIFYTTFVWVIIIAIINKFTFPLRKYTLGITAAISGMCYNITTMHIACKYNFIHSFSFHFSPILIPMILLISIYFWNERKNTK